MQNDAEAADSDLLADDDSEDDETSIAGQAASVVVDVSHTYTEDKYGLRIDKLASQVFTDFSRVQLQG